MRYIRSIKNLKEKTCLLRLDLNVQDDELKNSIRLDRAVESIQFLLKKGCRVLLVSYRGRPDVKRIGHDKKYRLKYSLKPVVREIERRMDERIAFVDYAPPSSWGKHLNGAKTRIVALENTRFYKEENQNSPVFAKKIAQLGDIYVNDAFAMSHRDQASLCAITKFLPSYAGIALEKEIAFLDRVAKKQEKPFGLILGGAKVSDKLGVLERFYNKTQWVLVGGGVANTFFVAQGFPVGSSLYEKGMLNVARIWAQKEKIHLPIDLAVFGGAILDIGPKTVSFYQEYIRRAKVIIWSGPVGNIEKKSYRRGTEGIIRALLASRASCVVGGGETTSAFMTYLRAHKKKLPARIFLSSGGGAMLAYLAKEKLPAFEALKQR